jgi:hypothetical protein
VHKGHAVSTTELCCAVKDTFLLFLGYTRIWQADRRFVKDR